MLLELKNIGLSDNEAKVYLAMLELGPSPVMEIAAKAGVNRPTAYVQIESLKKRGLASTQKKGLKTLFVAEDPEQLKVIIDQEEALLAQRKGELETLLPELGILFGHSAEKPQVRFFEGNEGVKRARKEFLNCKEKVVRGISAMDDVHKMIPDKERARGSEERIKRKIFSKFIYTSSKGPSLKENDAARYRESKCIPSGKLKINFDFTVFDDTVILESLHDKIFGVVVRHKDIAQSFKNLFDFIWDSLDQK